MMVVSAKPSPTNAYVTFTWLAFSLAPVEVEENVYIR